MSRSFVAALFLLGSLAAAEGLRDQRTWTGRNGKSFRGWFVGVEPKTGKFLFLDTRDRTFQIDPANLSDRDRTFIAEKQQAEADAGKPAPVADPPAPATAFKPTPALSRNTLPTIDQADYGSKASDCVPSSFCNFLLWWDQEKMLAIPKRGDWERRAEWVHDRMAVYMRTRNNSGTYADSARAGVEKYFREHLPKLATVRFLQTFDCSPANLARYASGANATMLEVSVFFDDDYEFGHWVAFSKADPSGQIEIITWGRRFQCTMKVVKEKDPKAREPRAREHPTYELVIGNKTDRTDFMTANDVRFLVDPARWDSLYIAKPYLFAVEGKAAPAPPDPEMTPPGRRAGPGR